MNDKNINDNQIDDESKIKKYNNLQGEEITPTPLDEQWLSMSQDWQSQPYDKMDITALIKQTQRRLLQAKALLAFDVIGTIVLSLEVLYGFYYDDWDKPTLMYTGTASILSIAFVFYAVKIRLASWRLFAVEPENIISTAIVGCKASLQYIKLLKLSCYAIFPMVNWYLYEIVTMKEKSLLIPLIFANSTILVMYFVSHYYQVKREKELVQLNKASLEL